jgi:phenylacetate-coenzyme A ligase PaaK-like adenylate-forming protein
VQPLIRYGLGDSVIAGTQPCRCGSALPTISVQGRCDDVLRFTDAHGHVVALPPLAIGSVADDTLGVRRSQLVQSSSTALRIRLDVEPGASLDQAWEGVRSKVAAYLAAQNLGNVEVIWDRERPQQNPSSGKYRQVIAASGP